MTEKRHPIQPIVKDEKGVLRFKRNKIIVKLLDDGNFDMNQIASWDISKDDRRQFAQLIGYSLSGFGDLSSYVDDETYGAAEMMVENGKSEADARIEFLRSLISSVKMKIREGVAELFEMHPEDLIEDDEVDS